MILRQARCNAEIVRRKMFFRPQGLSVIDFWSHALRRGLHSFSRWEQSSTILPRDEKLDVASRAVGRGPAVSRWLLGDGERHVGVFGGHQIMHGALVVAVGAALVEPAFQVLARCGT